MIQKYAHQDMLAEEQVLAYPGEVSADQLFMQELNATKRRVGAKISFGVVRRKHPHKKTTATYAPL
jgi:hypothetical protein